MIEIRKREASSDASDGAVLRFVGNGIHGVLLTDASVRRALFDFLSGSAENDRYEAFLSQGTVTQARGKLGCVPYELALYEDMSVGELLDFIGEAKGVAADRRARQIKEAISLTRLEKHKDKSLGKLSSYVRRRVLLAGALLGNPSVLLVEEPFAGLNAAQTRELTELILQIGALKPVLLLSISAELLPICSDVAVLTDSAVAYCGAADVYSEALSGMVKLSLTLSAAPSSVLDAVSAVSGVEIVSSCDENNVMVVCYDAACDRRDEITTACRALGCAVHTVTTLTPTVSDHLQHSKSEKGGRA